MSDSEKILEIYDAYVHGRQSRRDFLHELVRTAGGAAAAAAILPWLEGSGAEAATIAADDPRLATGDAEYGGAGVVHAYTARLKTLTKGPAVIVIHENRGLTDHIRDIARRLAVEGFFAVAPDMVSPRGGTPKDQDKARDVLYGIDKKVIETNLYASGVYASNHAHSSGRVGCVGFCWGGTQANLMAISYGKLKAAVAYYGAQPEKGIEKVNAALLLHYAEDDPGRNKGIDAYNKALKAAGKTFQSFTYPGTKHAFNNDTRPARYNKAAAELAWQRTVAHLKKYLA